MSRVQFIAEHVLYALGHAVVQSLWQCALIGSLAVLTARAARRPADRYAIWIAAMIAGFTWCVYTFAFVLIARIRAGSGLAGQDWTDELLLGSPSARSSDGAVIFGIVAVAWVIGFVFVSLRFSRQWLYARSLRFRGVSAADTGMESIFEALRDSFGVSSRVRMVISSVAQSPMVVGWVTPVVVVPASVITMLSPEQVRLVLAHELAHIRRNDHLVNMLQVLVESVMFYHPVVWWMSHQARIEREHCCDDAAVRVAGDAVKFARALADLEEVRLRSRAVLGLHQGGSLMKRIQRLIHGTETRRGTGATVVLSAAVLVTGTAYAYTSMRGEPLVEGVELEQAVVVGVEYVPRSEANAEVIDFLRRHVTAGSLSREQAFELYSRAVRGSYEQSMELIESKIWAAIDAGNLSEADGIAKINGQRDGIAWEIEHQFLKDVYQMGSGDAKLDLLAKKLDAEVESGSLTREQADAKLEQARRSADAQPVRLGVAIGQGVPIVDSVPLVVEGHPITEGTQNASFKLLLQKEMDMLDSMVERGELSMDEAKARYDSLLLHVLEILKLEGQKEYVGVLIEQMPEGEPAGAGAGGAGAAGGAVGGAGGGAGAPQTIKVEPIGTEGKLTPMDEAYFLHQGIRSLSAYDESFGDDC